MMPSSLREMPTVTVLAWCLIVSTGRVSSSMAWVSAATTSSISAAGVPTLPDCCWYCSIGRSDEHVAEQPVQPDGRRRFEVPS